MCERYKYVSKKTYFISMKHKLRIVTYILEYIKKYGYAPLQTEIAKAVGLSNSHINRYYWQLVDSGVLILDCNQKSRRHYKVADNWEEEFKYFVREVI